MTVKLKKGMAPTDMNLTQEFGDARQEIETKKQQEKENNDPRQKFWESETKIWQSAKKF